MHVQDRVRCNKLENTSLLPSAQLSQDFGLRVNLILPEEVFTPSHTELSGATVRDAHCHYIEVK